MGTVWRLLFQEATSHLSGKRTRGNTAAKNAPYPAVELIKYGIKTATPAPTPIPQEVSVAFDICDPTGFVHAVGTEGNDKGKCLELAFGGGKSQSQFWAKDGWKYSDNKVWSTGHCDRAAFPTLFSEDADFGGWTAAKNSDQVPSCGNVNMTRFSPKAALFAEVDTTTFVHQIVTSPGDHCLEITIPGGNIPPFWKANAWKYSAPDRPEWKTGACDHTKWNDVDSTTEDYDGYTAAKNAPYPAVELIKYGIKTATPAPTPIPQEVEQLMDATVMKCESMTGTHSVTVSNSLNVELMVRTCNKYTPVSGAPCTGNMLKPNHYVDCPNTIPASGSVTFTFNGDTQYIAFTDATA